ncbi:MAG: GNAT family N-acetyltransferase [Ruminococcus sp.]|nr:GNAT family N-acetyltransferase [Ruminococcus sp.]
MNYRYEMTDHASAGCVTLRTEVFVDEQGFAEEFDEIDDRAVHLCIYEGDLPVASGRLYSDDGVCCHIGRVVVAKSHRGRHLGEAVMRRLEEEARRIGYREAALSSQDHAIGFYEKMGYAPVGAFYMDQHCPHKRMVKSL